MWRKKLAKVITHKNAEFSPKNSKAIFNARFLSINGATMAVKNMTALGFVRLMINPLRYLLFMESFCVEVKSILSIFVRKSKNAR